MDTAEVLPLSEQEYLAAEQTAEIKHEYIDGQAYAMTGASINHARVSGNLHAELRQRLKGQPCEAFVADVKIKAHGNYFYPDVMVICERSPSDTEYVKHAPTVIVEVLSPSTRKKDLTTKKLAYLNLPSVQEYLLIEQDKCEVEVLRRNDNWAPAFYFLGDDIVLESIGVTIPVAEIYERVENQDMAAFLTDRFS